MGELSTLEGGREPPPCSRCQTIPSPKRTWVSCPHPGWDYEASHPKEQSSDALGARACSGTDCLPFPEMALKVILETVSFTQYLGVCGTHKSKIWGHTEQEGEYSQDLVCNGILDLGFWYELQAWLSWKAVQYLIIYYSSAEIRQSPCSNLPPRLVAHYRFIE